jgi:hypothetical protein
MYRLPDNFIPSRHGVQVLQVISESYSYEITTIEQNGNIGFAISVASLNNPSSISFYMLSSNELKLYDIFTEFEDYDIKFSIVYSELEDILINKVVTTPIKNFLETFGILILHITHN